MIYFFFSKPKKIKGSQIFYGLDNINSTGGKTNGPIQNGAKMFAASI